MNLSEVFIRRPVATLLLALAIVLGGCAAYATLPVSSLPQVDFPTIEVSAGMPGASPEIVAATLASPLEKQFAQIAGVTQMTSLSTAGSTAVTLQFELSRDIDAAAQDVQAAITAAAGQLPTNLQIPPSYRKVNPSDAPILLLAVRSRYLPMTSVDDVAETILGQAIAQVEGVAQLAIAGQQKPSVRVRADPAILAAHGLSLSDVAARVKQETSNGPKGTVTGPARSYTIYANDQLLTAAPYNDIVLRYRNGQPLRVRDVGEAIIGPANTFSLATGDLDPAILLVVYKQPGANVIETVDRIKALLPTLTASITPAIEVAVMIDHSQTIRASVRDVQTTLVITIVLVVLVILAFVGSVRATIVPAVAVPLSVLGTFAVMAAFGYTLDNLSLMALVVAVGFVVDDAIVVLENIQRHVDEGESLVEAAVRGAGEIGFTVVSISLSLVAVFIPLLLMPGIIGRLFREFAITTSAAILISGIVSLTLTPMLSARLLRPEGARNAEGRDRRRSLLDRLVDGYAASLDVALRFRGVTLLVFVATVALTAILFVAIPKSFFPEEDTGILLGRSEAAADVAPDAFARLNDALARVLLADPAVAHVTTATGNTAQASNIGYININLKPREQRDAAPAVIERLRPRLAEVEGAKLFLQSVQDVRVGGRASKATYQYTLQGTDLAELSAFSRRLVERLRRAPALTDVATDEEPGGPTLTVTIDRDRAARFGITPQAIDAVLGAGFGQVQATQYFTQVNSYSVIVEVPVPLQGDPKTLDKLYVASPMTGGMVPLPVFASVDSRPVAPLSIAHQSGFPAITISFNLAPGASLGQAVEVIDAATRDLGLPGDIIAGFQGTAAAFQSSLQSVPMLILAALVVIYIILGVLYESAVHPLTILSTLPPAGIGAFLVLQFTGIDFSIITLIGLILLIGIVKKNGIMLVDFAIAAEKAGLDPDAAIRQACRLRFRPILMTTVAALLGAIPLMVAFGTGAELRQPLGFTLFGGLVLSQVLTLYTTPAIYLAFSDLTHRRRSQSLWPQPQQEQGRNDRI